MRDWHLTRRSLLAGAAGATLPVWLASCSSAPPQQVVDFDAWAERVAADCVRLFPELATRTQYFAGAEQAALDRRLTPQAQSQWAIATPLLRTALVQLERFDATALTPRQRLHAGTLRWSFQVRLAGLPYEDHRFVFNQFWGVHVELIEFLTERHPLRGPDDVDAYLARLDELGLRIDEARGRAAQAAARGLRPPRFIAERARGQVAQFLAAPAGENPLVASLARRAAPIPGFGDAQLAAAVRQAEALVTSRVRPAFMRLQDWLDALLPLTGDDAGLWRLPDGEAAYAAALAQYTTTTLDAREIHATGLREVARLEAEMDRVLRGLGRHQGSVIGRIRRLNAELQPPADPDPRPALLEKYAAYVREAQERARPLFGRMPRAPVEVRRVSPLIERTAAASYTAPAPDGSMPGIFWVPLPGPRYEILGMKSLAVHEAVPGHHFQSALLGEDRALPRWAQRAVFSGGSANWEGWALYAEALAIEQGWYADDPHALLGALDSQLFRARRLVVDTGLHALRWTRSQAIEYGIWAAEVERYVAIPGQACAYMIGMLRFRALRDEAQRALGPRFSMPAFHDAVLGAGAVPLDVLSEAVHAWIAQAA
jgi:uncharacterized protein (DUF885 family)